MAEPGVIVMLVRAVVGPQKLLVEVTTSFCPVPTGLTRTYCMFLTVEVTAGSVIVADPVAKLSINQPESEPTRVTVAAFFDSCCRTAPVFGISMLVLSGVCPDQPYTEEEKFKTL